MKKIIFWAVIRARFLRNARGYYEILEVTTEKGRQVYGRDDQEASTHVAARDVLKRCETRAEAESILARAERIRTAHRARISAARKELARVEALERVELEALVR